MKKIRTGLALALGLMLMLAQGCGGGDAPAAAPPGPAADKPAKDKVAPGPGKSKSRGKGAETSGAGPVASPEKLEKLKNWIYNPETKWDPFIQPEIGPDPKGGGERFDIDQMVLYGVVRGSGMDRAFIRLPDGTDRIVKVGDKLGKHNGRVTKIESDAIVVEEKFFDPTRPNEIFVINKRLPLVKLSK